MKTKQQEMDDPNSCWNKAKLDEPVFIILGRDIVALGTIEDWIDRRVSIGKNDYEDGQTKEAYEVAKAMKSYRRDLDK